MPSRSEPSTRVAYRSLMSDNARWDALTLRDGDVVISAPSKCGMTWMQRLVALLLFDGPELPAPMSTLSPWLDQTIRPVDDVVAVLDAQPHRRFIKTHTPLDGLALDARVTYLGVGRDPRDAALSAYHQSANQNPDRMRALHDAAMPPGAPAPPPWHPAPPPPGAAPAPTPLDAFHHWMEAPLVPPEGMGSLATVVHHFDTFWRRRHLPNVALFHYADLQDDLVGEFVALGDVLGVPTSRARAEQLTAHASLEVMRSRAAELAPNTTDGLWRSNERFFRAAGRGEWRAVFTIREHRRYDDLVARFAPPDLRAWMHDGRRRLA